MPRPAVAAQDKLGSDAFQAALDQAKAGLLAARPGSRDVAAALAFVENPPEAYTKNADKLTAILATAVTFDRQQVVADRNICRNGTDLMGEGTRVLVRADRGAFHSASPAGALGIVRRGWKREVLEQITLCEGRPPSPPGPCWPTSCPGGHPLHRDPRPRRRHLPGPAGGPHGAADGILGRQERGT